MKYSHTLLPYNSYKNRVSFSVSIVYDESMLNMVICMDVHVDLSVFITFLAIHVKSGPRGESGLYWSKIKIEGNFLLLFSWTHIHRLTDLDGIVQYFRYYHPTIIALSGQAGQDC